MRIAAHGLALELPAGWEARIYRRPEALPVLHAASFALPAGDGDFATGATEIMPPGAVLIALLEYEPALAGTALFAEPGPPRAIAAEASATGLPRRLPGRRGVQRFFNAAGRAFCLYVVVAAAAGARASATSADDVLGTLRID
jgi:hypothetical protein